MYDNYYSSGNGIGIYNPVLPSSQNVRDIMDYSKIFIIEGEGDYDSSTLKTRVRINKTSPYTYLTSSSFSNLDLSGMELAIFLSSGSGYNSSTYDTLPEAAIEHGAENAIGVVGNIYNNDAKEWVAKFFEFYAYIYDVQDCVEETCEFFSYGEGLGRCSLEIDDFLVIEG